MEFVDPYGWHELDAAKLNFIRQKLANFETMTWGEILINAKKHHHTVATADLCAQARKRLTELKLDDVDGLVSLKLSGTNRIWGMFSAGVLTLLWWDPDHEICPSTLKHT